MQEFASHRGAVSVARRARGHRATLLRVRGSNPESLESGRHGVRRHALRAPVGGGGRRSAAPRARGDGRTRSHVPILEGCGGFATHLPALSGRRATRLRAPHLPGHMDHRLGRRHRQPVEHHEKTRRHLVEPRPRFRRTGRGAPRHRRAKVFRRGRRREMRDVPRARAGALRRIRGDE